jgi:hypothetical protein
MANKKDKEQQGEVWSIDEDSLAGGWAPASESVTVNYTGSGSLDTMDISDMMRADAGKGMENMKFDDFLPGKPFEDTVPSLQTIDKVCQDYPSLNIAYEKFKNVWRICYTDYCTNNPDEENY